MKTFWYSLAALAVVAAVLFIPFKKGRAQQPAIVLEWTAPGDDGNVGAATSYQIRRATSPIAGTDTTGWWNAATPVSGAPAPQVAGTQQTMQISTGLNWATTYYFIIRAVDEVGNIGPYSNVASKTIGPMPDVTPPNRIVDFIVR